MSINKKLPQFPYETKLSAASLNKLGSWGFLPPEVARPAQVGSNSDLSIYIGCLVRDAVGRASALVQSPQR
jgi:hypothetical protein